MDQPTVSAFEDTGGGDSGWFLAVGWGFFSGQEHGWIRRIPFTNAQIPTPPVYIVFAGIFQRFLSDHATVVTMRLLQCLASVATAYLVYRIGAVLAGQRAGLAGAALATFHPALIFEPANIATETLYLFFLACGLWLYGEYVVDALCRHKVYRLKPGVAVALTAIALSLATLTRAISVLFPLCLALHLLLLRRRRLISNWRGKAVLLLAIYALIVSTWTVYNLALWDRFVLASDQLLATIWRGFERDDGSPQQNDALLLEGVEVYIPEGCEADCKYQHPAEVYVQKIRDIIDADPAGLVALRVNELAYSLMQPHGTTGLGDVSIRQAAGRVVAGEPFARWTDNAHADRGIRNQACHVVIPLERHCAWLAWHDPVAKALAPLIASYRLRALHCGGASLFVGSASLPVCPRNSLAHLRRCRACHAPRPLAAAFKQRC